MREIVMISGKGGTGKTSITASFAVLAEEPVLADCDVDAADLHLVLAPTVESREPFSGGALPAVDSAACTGCGRCVSLCRFDAVRLSADGKNAVVDPVACEGCGVCAWFCGPKAIAMEAAVNGELYRSTTRVGPMVHARLGPAEENSGKLVTAVREAAKSAAEAGGRNLLLVDGSPGIGCPVIASVTGADRAVIVTEPTVSGEHDLVRVADLARHFDIPASVIVNKADINPQKSAAIRALCEARGMTVLGEVPYDENVTAAMLEEKALVEYDPQSPAARSIRACWECLGALEREL